MKRFLLVILSVLILTLCACSKTADPPQESVTPTATPEQTETPAQTDGVTPVQSLAPSTNKTVVTEKEAPTVYWTMDIAYHLPDCPELEKKENTEVTWQMVKEVGLRQCPVCNPPQYENYIEQ